MNNLGSPIIQQQKKPSMVWTILDVLFPPFCCNCGVLGYELCPDCFNEITLSEQRHICKICGCLTQEADLCNRCSTKKQYFDQLRSWGIYDGVLRNAIIRIKFNRGFGLIDNFTQTCADFISKWNIKIDTIIPVPLSKARLKSRGYNQAALLTKPISRLLHHSYRPEGLIRIKDTASQVGLNAQKRVQNVRNAFEGNLITENKSILVIDDIATTGSTLNECAKALRKAGAKEVFCFTLARTPLSDYGSIELEDK